MKFYTLFSFEKIKRKYNILILLITILSTWMYFFNTVTKYFCNFITKFFLKLFIFLLSIYYINKQFLFSLSVLQQDSLMRNENNKYLGVCEQENEINAKRGRTVFYGSQFRCIQIAILSIYLFRLEIVFPKK